MDEPEIPRQAEDGTGEGDAQPHSIQLRHLAGVHRYRKQPKRSVFPALILVITFAAVFIVGKKMRQASVPTVDNPKKSGVSYVHSRGLDSCRVVFGGNVGGITCLVDGVPVSQAIDTLMLPAGWHTLLVLKNTDTLYSGRDFFKPGGDTLYPLE